MVNKKLRAVGFCMLLLCLVKYLIITNVIPFIPTLFVWKEVGSPIVIYLCFIISLSIMLGYWIQKKFQFTGADFFIFFLFAGFFYFFYLLMQFWPVVCLILSGCVLMLLSTTQSYTHMCILFIKKWPVCFFILLLILDIGDFVIFLQVFGISLNLLIYHTFWYESQLHEVREGFQVINKHWSRDEEQNSLWIVVNFFSSLQVIITIVIFCKSNLLPETLGMIGFYMGVTFQDLYSWVLLWITNLLVLNSFLVFLYISK
jgi:hypothetical protein